MMINETVNPVYISNSKLNSRCEKKYYLNDSNNEKMALFCGNKTIRIINRNKIKTP